MANFPLTRQTKADMLCREATAKQESHADHPSLVPVVLLLRVTSVSIGSVSQPRSRLWNAPWECGLEDANRHLHLRRNGQRYWNHEKHGVVIFTIISRHNCSRQLPPDDDTFGISRLSSPSNVPQQSFPLVRTVRIKVNVPGLSTTTTPATLRGRPAEYQIWTRRTAEQRHWSPGRQSIRNVRRSVLRSLVSQAKRLAQQEACIPRAYHTNNVQAKNSLGVSDPRCTKCSAKAPKGLLTLSNGTLVNANVLSLGDGEQLRSSVPVGTIRKSFQHPCLADLDLDLGRPQRPLVRSHQCPPHSFCAWG